jgi:hypothetical protein
VRGPFVLALSRMVLAVGGGWLALTIGDGPLGLFAASAAAFVVFAIGLLAVTRRRFDVVSRR